MAEPIKVDDSNFNSEVINSNIPVLVDFWAVWCGPCRTIAPTIHKLAEELNGKAKICKMDVDSSPNTAAEYGVRSIPTLIFFKEGKEVNRIIGVTEKDKIISCLLD